MYTLAVCLTVRVCECDLEDASGTTQTDIKCLTNDWQDTEKTLFTGFFYLEFFKRAVICVLSKILSGRSSFLCMCSRQSGSVMHIYD